MPYPALHQLLTVSLWLCVIAYIVVIALLVINVMSENRRPLSTLGWVTALIFFPLGGALLYYLFGRSLRNVRMISRRNRRKLREATNTGHSLPRLDSFSHENRHLIRLASCVADAELYSDNSVEVFNTGARLYARMFSDLRDARKYINLQFYIIANDTLGRELCDILIDKARNGVKVRVIYDYIGSVNKGQSLFTRLKESGVEIHAFFRVQFPDKINRINWRNHRKVVVIDGKIGYIGGFNMAKRYIDGGNFDCWRDLMVRVTGPVMAGLEKQFAIDWNFMGHPLITEITDSSGEAGQDAVRGVTAQIVASGPTTRWGAVGLVFFKAISGARSRVWIQTPYFLPDDELIRALQCAAMSGVDVRVMTPLHSDSALLTHASGSFVEDCLMAGIKVYFFKPGMLHSKMLIVDNDFSTLGSTNFDYRSFEHNFEENIVMYSREVNERLAELYLADQADCKRIKLSEWHHRPNKVKVYEAICRLLSPIL